MVLKLLSNLDSTSILPSSVNTVQYVDSVLQAVATRAFLRPSKQLLVRYMKPVTSWKHVDYVWSNLSKTVPSIDFWNPCPGFACDWKIKVQLFVHSYMVANLTYIFICY